MDKFATYAQEQKARRELVEWGRELYGQGLVKGSGGNLSIRLDEATSDCYKKSILQSGLCGAVDGATAK